MRHDIDINALRTRLLQRARELEALAGTRSDAGAPLDLDTCAVGRLSRMDALQEQSMARAGDARARAEYRRIRTALARIDSGEYGYCLDCNEEIARGRLEADPAAPLCIDCAAEREGR